MNFFYINNEKLHNKFFRRLLTNWLSSSRNFSYLILLVSLFKVVELKKCVLPKHLTQYSLNLSNKLYVKINWNVTIENGSQYVK